MTRTLDEALRRLKGISSGMTTKTPLPDEALVRRYETEIGFRFSEDYKRFLKEVSNVYWGSISPLVITPDRTSRLELSAAIEKGRAIGLPRDWLPICEDNGDFYCLLESGQVRFWSHDGSTDECWPDLGTWIDSVWIGEG